VKKTKKEGVDEGTTQKFSSAKIDRAIKIAKSMGGNMTNAVKKIEKIEKNLSKNGRVEYALQQANEGLGDKMSKISKKYAKGQKKSKKALKNKKGPYQEEMNETPYELGGMKVYSKADGLKKVKSMQKTDGAKIHKVTKTKTKLYGKHPVTMYNLHTKNKNHSTRQNPYGLDMMKGVYLIPDKESVNEGLDKRQAAELLKQLGGNKFIAMTGAKNFTIGKDGLAFKIGRNAKAVNYVVIQLNGKDLYDMKFQKGTRVLKKANDVYADQLQKMFTKYTGMDTRL